MLGVQYIKAFRRKNIQIPAAAPHNALTDETERNEFRGAYAGSGLCLSFAFTEILCGLLKMAERIESIILGSGRRAPELKVFQSGRSGEKTIFGSSHNGALKPSSGSPAYMPRQPKRWQETKGNNPEERRAKDELQKHVAGRR